MGKLIRGTVQDPNEMWEKRVPIDKAILNFLEKGPKGLNQIIEYIHANDPQPTYYTKIGILKILNNLLEENLIEKSRERRPQYFLTNKALNDTTLKAILFSSDTKQLLLNNFSCIVPGKEKEFLKDMIVKIGLFHMYLYLKSWEYVKGHKSPKNLESRLTWLRHSFPLKGFPFFMDEKISYLRPKAMKNTDVVKIDSKTQQEYDLKTVIKFENMIQDLYPEQIDLLNSLWFRLPETLQSTKAMIKDCKIINRKRKYKKKI